MRRRHTRGRIEIPEQILSTTGEYEHAPEVPWGEKRPRAPWETWCHSTGFSTLEFLREAMQRQLAVQALEDPTGPWRHFHPDPPGITGTPGAP